MRVAEWLFESIVGETYDEHVARIAGDTFDGSDEDDDPDGDAGEWDPEPPQLRDGETRDESSHARRNLEQIRELEGDGDDADGDDSETELHVPDDDCVVIS